MLCRDLLVNALPNFVFLEFFCICQSQRSALVIEFEPSHVVTSVTSRWIVRALDPEFLFAIVVSEIEPLNLLVVHVPALLRSVVL